MCLVSEHGGGRGVEGQAWFIGSQFKSFAIDGSGKARHPVLLTHSLTLSVMDSFMNTIVTFTHWSNEP